MNFTYRTIAILGLSLFIANCNKGKTPVADAAAATASSASVNMLGVYDLNSVKQIQFETSATNSYRGGPGPNDIVRKILILTVSGGLVTGSGVYLETTTRKCQASAPVPRDADLRLALGEAALGPNTHSAIAPDAGYDRLGVFLNDGSSRLIPFNDVGAPLNQSVILEAADEPLNNLLSSLYDSATCTPNQPIQGS